MKNQKNNYSIEVVEKDQEFVKSINRVISAEKVVNELKIRNTVDEKQGVIIGKGLTDCEKQLKEQQEKWTKTANDYIKTIKNLIKPKLDNIKDLKSILNKKMADYRMIVEEEARKEQERLEKIRQKEIEKQQKEMEKAIKKDKPIPEMKPLTETCIEVAKSIQSNDSKVTYRTIKKWRVIKENDIPRQYMKIDEAKIIAAMRANIVIPGIEYYEDKAISYR